MKLRIAVFEQNKNIRKIIDQLLFAEKSFELAGSFGYTNHCLTDINNCRPNIIIMDIDTAGTDGIEEISRIKAEFPAIHILIQTATEEDDRLYATILAGASGYILKSRLRMTLVRSVKEISFGGAPMSPSIARRVLHLVKRKNIARPKGVVNYPLTKREREVLKCLVNGHNYKTISSGMKISYETVRSHMKKIYEKLQVASLTEVVAKAIYQNIV